MSIADKLVAIAENEQKVYDAGVDKGTADGKLMQYNAFWNMMQQNGERKNYRYAFFDWDGAYDTFKPKYDIKPVGDITSMFQQFNTYINLVSVCEKQGIVMDFSKVTNFTTFLYDSSIYRIGVIDCSSVVNFHNAFLNAGSLTTIDKIIVNEGIKSYDYSFTNVSNLQNIVIEGVIAGNYLDISSATKLTHDSLFGKTVTAEEAADLPAANVIEFNGAYYYGGFILALKNYGNGSIYNALTIGKTNLDKLTDAEKAVATEKGWTLIG